MSDTPAVYPKPIRILHWILAVAMLGMIGLGWYMTELLPREAANRGDIYALHKSIGVTIFFLAAWRLWFRLTRTLPGKAEGVSKVENQLATLVHYAFYAFMLSIPLVGYLMSNAGNHDVVMFGIKLPRLIEPNKELGGLFNRLHAYFAYTVLVLAGLHVAGVIKHYVVDKHNLLKRMWG